MHSKLEILLIRCKVRKDIFIANFKERIINEEDGITTVEIVIGIVVFALLAILVYNQLSGSIQGKSNQAAQIIDGATLK